MRGYRNVQQDSLFPWNTIYNRSSDVQREQRGWRVGWCNVVCGFWQKKKARRTFAKRGLHFQK